MGTEDKGARGEGRLVDALVEGFRPAQGFFNWSGGLATTGYTARARCNAPRAIPTLCCTGAGGPAGPATGMHSVGGGGVEGSVQFFFADDAKQGRPTRDGMGPLVATGGVVVPGDRVRSLEREIDGACQASGFPPGEEFKWSPDRGQWMHANLVGNERLDFFMNVLGLAAAHGAEALVVIDDTRHRTAIPDAPSHEADVTRMFIERADNYLRYARVNDHGVVIADRPGGDRREEDKFLLDCLETLQVGTKYVKPERIALPVLSVRSDLVRLAQLVDVVTSCTLSYVAGEAQYAPPVFEGVKTLLLKEGQRIGGIGLKIHPDFVYANLYHWLLGDSHHVKFQMGIPFPLGRPYRQGPDRY